MNTTVISAGALACPPIFAVTLAMQTFVEYLIYLGAILLITAVAALWVIGTRRPHQHSDHRHRHHHASRGWFGLGSLKEKSRGLSGKKRRRRRSHRKQNPTLAETGGLPPIRGETSSTTEDPRT